MASCPALRLMAGHHIAVRELAERCRDLLAALSVNRSINPDRFHGYHLAIDEPAILVVHPDQKLVALCDLKMSAGSHVEAPGILLSIEEVTSGQLYKVAFHTFHWITARLFEAR